MGSIEEEEAPGMEGGMGYAKGVEEATKWNRDSGQAGCILSIP